MPPTVRIHFWGHSKSTSVPWTGPSSRHLWLVQSPVQLKDKVTSISLPVPHCTEMLIRGSCVHCDKQWLIPTGLRYLFKVQWNWVTSDELRKKGLFINMPQGYTGLLLVLHCSPNVHTLNILQDEYQLLKLMVSSTWIQCAGVRPTHVPLFNTWTDLKHY